MAGEKTSATHKLLTVVGVILCVILVPILITNLTLIGKGLLNKEEVPSIGGVLPMIVLTDSMYPEIQSGDLILCHTIDAEQVKVGDVISFFDPAGNGTSVTTHRVVEIVRQDGALAFRTRGDHNNTEDKLPVPASDLVGVYKTRLPGVGHVAMFMQSTTGLILCVVLPILLLVGYDVVRRRAYEKTTRQDTAALLAELEALRARQAEQDTASADN